MAAVVRLAIMQPCYLPWRGYFALARLADALIHLDDVPFPQGRTLQSRIALKTAQGRSWLTVPVRRKSAMLISDVEIAGDTWRAKHVRTLTQHFPRAFEHIADLLERPWTLLADLNIALAERVAAVLQIRTLTSAVRSHTLRVDQRSWRRILAFCQMFGAGTYITGHGARHYLNHLAFEEAGVQVMYLDYDLSAYPQAHGPFDPYVSVLDVLEHAADPLRHVHARLVPWRDFLHTAPFETAEHAGSIFSRSSPS